MKAGAKVARLTPGGVAFADGSELAADVVVVATGCTPSITILQALH